MIAQINGILIEKQSTEVVIDCGGVGYLLFVSVKSSSKLGEIGARVKLKTILIPREDQFLLFGFYDDIERDLFKLITSVSGIGPKTALGILSAVNPDEFAKYIIEGNLFALQKMPGIGKKTAERLLVELRDKVGKISTEAVIDSNSGDFIIKSEALSAMMTLGYNRAIAEKAINKAIAAKSNQKLDAATLIKDALKFAIE